ncbi:CGP-CTERM sorting domain-containing protein [Thermococcus guaymasensis]
MSTTTTKPTSPTASGKSSSKRDTALCGPATILGLLLTPLLMRRKR